MKRMKRIGAMLLTFTMAAGIVQTNVMAADVPSAVRTETKTFTSFVQAGTQVGQVSFELGQAETELTAQMPQTLTVNLVDGTTTEIPVTWICLGDYANTDDFYYEFIPQWDMNTYTPAYVLDSASDVPYIMARRVESGSDRFVQQGNYNAIPTNAKTIFNFLVKECGYNTAAACGVLANIEAESNFRPDCKGDGGSSYGICQWHNGRWTSMKNWCNQNGYDWTSLNGQLHYLKKELSANNSAYLWNGKTINEYMKKVPNTAQGAYDAGYYWCYYYEVPADKQTRSVARGNTAKNKYWSAFKDTTVDGGQDQVEDSGAVYHIFKDVHKGDWYCSAIQFVYDKKLMSGVTKTTFCPKDPLNRAMATVILHSLSQTDKRFKLTASGGKKFDDVWYGAWFYDAVKWANGAGLVQGYNDHEFKPTKDITREQFVSILYNYAKKLGWNVSGTSLSKFSDSGKVTDYAVPAMKWAVKNGVVCGDKGRLKPQSSLTRAEAAVMIKSFMSVGK